MPRLLFRDYETRSTLILGGKLGVGAARYARHRDTSVLCAAYCVDNEPVKLWLPGDPIPEVWLEAVNNPDYLVVAFNDFFEASIERDVLAPRHGWPMVPIERHRCLQASALSLALPAKLEKVAAALSLSHQKDDPGHTVMLRLSKPRPPRRNEDPAGGPYWDNTPAKFEALYRYCKQDIEVERALHERIGLLPPDEQEIWLLDETVNSRGAPFDTKLLGAAIAIGDTVRAELNHELQEITGSAVETTNKLPALKAWLAEHGCEVDDMEEGTLSHALERKALDPACRRAIELRLDGAHAAVQKLITLYRWAEDDGRIRGAFRYHGAGPGRWSSPGSQLHNMKRTGAIDVTATPGAVSTGEIARVRDLSERPLSLIGCLTRAMVQASPGCRFLIGDFSGVESRVLAFLAGEKSKLDLWSNLAYPVVTHSH